MKIYNRLKIGFLKKAYIEGVYADTPANRKLGRVGMSYLEYSIKMQKGEDPTKTPLTSTKKFTIEEIKEKVNKEIDKYKKKNDYITISTDNDYTFRFARNMSMEGNNDFNECLVKNKDGKVLKTFKNTHEEDLMNSVYKYIQALDVDIVSIDKENKENINKEQNINIIKAKMKEAKDSQIGTIIAKGNDGIIVYLSRDKKGRWLKDFDNYAIRDSKKNILAKGKVKSEEEFISKLSEELSKHKIQLEGVKE